MITVNKISDQLNRILVDVKQLNPKTEFGSQLVRTAALTELALMRNRIGNEGKATDETKIGEYSTKPIYVSLTRSTRRIGRPLGKPYNGKRRSRFKSTGKDHKSRYFEGGYNQFKTAVGRNTLGSVNLYLTGDFLRSLTLFKTNDGWGLGWSDEKYIKRALFFEKKYGKSIFGMSKKERLIVIREVKRQLNALSR